MTTIHRQAAPPPRKPAPSAAPQVPRLEYFNAHHTDSRSGRFARHLRLTVPFVAGLAAVVAVLVAAYLIRNSAGSEELNWRWLGQSVRDCVVFGAFSSLLFALALNRDAFPRKDLRPRLPLLAASAGAAQALIASACIRANELIEVPGDVVMIVTLLLVLVYPALVALLLGRLARDCDPRDRSSQIKHR